MLNEISLGSVRVYYGGKQFGNVDSRFDPEVVVEKRLIQAKKQLSTKSYVQIKALGGNSIADLEIVKFQLGWNYVECDTLITYDSQVSLVIFPADCIPLVIYSTQSNLCALVHIGHLGAQLGIYLKVLHYLIDNKGEQLTNLRFYLGPSINKESYYFESIDNEQANSPDWKPYITRSHGDIHIDLPGYVISQLIKFGIKSEQIKIADIEDYCKDYFSHRRSVLSGEKEGRNFFAVNTVK